MVIFFKSTYVNGTRNQLEWLVKLSGLSSTLETKDIQENKL